MEEEQFDPDLFMDYSEDQPMKKKKKDQTKPGTRESMFGQVFPASTEDQWTNMGEIGYYHITEHASFAKTYKKCAVRGTWHHYSMMFVVENGDPICIEEANENYEACEYSHMYVKKGELKDALNGDGDPIKISPYSFASSFFSCDYDKKRYPRSTRVQITHNEKYKHVWFGYVGKHFFQCASCSNYFTEAIAPVRADIGNEHVCGTCYVKQKKKNVIQAHNANNYPAPIHSNLERLGHKVEDGLVYALNKYVPRKDIRLFGVEVETEFDRIALSKAQLDRYSMAVAVKDVLGEDFVMVKEDGTLIMNGKYSDGGTGMHYAGFEIVTAPADMKIHQERWAKLDKMKEYKFMRAWDTDTCGFHVHVSKEALTTLQIGRMLYFINHKKNHNFVQKVAGRSEVKFTKYMDKNITDCRHPERNVNPDEESAHNRSRRVALNTVNPKTVEFRIFRGTVNPRHILRNIEFCDAICDFCHPASRSFKDLADYSLFIKFVDENRKKWTLLAEWFAYHKMGVSVNGVCEVVESKKIVKGDRHVAIKKYVKRELEAPEEHEIKLQKIVLPKLKPEPIAVAMEPDDEADGDPEDGN